MTNRPFLLKVGLSKKEINCTNIPYDANTLEYIARRILYTYRQKEIPDCLKDISDIVWGRLVLPNQILVNYVSIMTLKDYTNICTFNEIKKNIDFFNFISLCKSDNTELSHYILKNSNIALLNSARLDGDNLLHTSLRLDETEIKIDQLKILLDLGENINLVNDDLKTPLEIALEDGISLSTLQFLILSGGVVANPVSSIVQKRYNIAMQDLFKKALVSNLVLDELPNKLKKIIIRHLFTPILK